MGVNGSVVVYTSVSSLHQQCSYVIWKYVFAAMFHVYVIKWGIFPWFWLSNQRQPPPVIHIWNASWVTHPIAQHTQSSVYLNLIVYISRLQDRDTSPSTRNNEALQSVHSTEFGFCSLLCATVTSYHSRWKFCRGMYALFAFSCMFTLHLLTTDKFFYRATWRVSLT